MASTQKRPMLSRQKIRAYLARIEGGLDPSSHAERMRTVEKTYSGFVHGVSPHIMEMYSDDPPHFQVRGIKGELAEEHRQDLWNFFHRGIVSFVCSTKAFGMDPLCEKLLEYMRTFARAKGEDYAQPPR